MNNQYYVYGHYKKDTNELFYVGKGKGKRAWYKRKTTNLHWVNVAKKYGYDIRIFKENLSEDDALELEELIIATVGLENLTNITPGGNQPPSTLGTKKIHLGKENKLVRKEELEKFIKVGWKLGWYFSKEQKENLAAKARKTHTGRNRNGEFKRKMSKIANKNNNGRTLPLQNIKVKQYDQNHKLIKVFNSVNEALKTVGVSDVTFQKYCRKGKLLKGYYYVKEKRKIKNDRR